ncbi:unnamed protein product [Brachionus calyciflorus]|uniref:Uncharacterized protein n=1 Tax=Brachionus calyciflorus TaxID=104777 RepID=A0A813RBB1_9BILA|nr:unnamed protein product [Brachionus calyciflorus]
MEEKLRLLNLNDDDKNFYSLKTKKNKNIDNIQPEVNLNLVSNSVITHPIVNIVEYSDSESTITVNDQIDECDLDTISLNDEIEECNLVMKYSTMKKRRTTLNLMLILMLWMNQTKSLSNRYIRLQLKANQKWFIVINNTCMKKHMEMKSIGDVQCLSRFNAILEYIQT